MIEPADTPISSEDQLKHLFTYHPPTTDQQGAYLAIRSLALELALLIHKTCPSGPDRSAAIRKLRECVFTANAGIATGGGYYP